MGRFARRSVRFLADDDGPTAIEYAFMLALLLLVSISILTTMGRSVSRSFSATNTAIPSGTAS